MLRHYDEHGLLVPAFIPASNEPSSHACMDIWRLPERYVASLRRVILAYDQEGLLWQQLNEEIAPQNVRPETPCYGLAIFHDEGFKDSDVDVEIQVSVAGTYKDTEHVRFKKTAPIQMASSAFKGVSAL